MKIELPWPDKSLFPNRKHGQHWTTTSAQKVVANKAGFVAGLQAFNECPTFPDGDIPISVTFHFPDKRKRDADNLLAACKQMLDGVAIALGVDDSRFWPITLHRVMDGQGKVVVEICVASAAEKP